MSAVLWALLGGAVASVIAFLGGYGVARRKDAFEIGELQKERDYAKRERDAARRDLRRTTGADPTLDELQDAARAHPGGS